MKLKVRQNNYLEEKILIKEAIGIAATVEEAKEKALNELNATFEDDVQVEVLACPKSKILGIFGGSDAKVKVSIEVPDPKPAKAGKSNNRQKKNAEAKKEAAPKKEKAEVKKEQLKEIDIETIDANSPAGKAVAYLKSVLKELGCADVALSVAEVSNGIQITLEGEGLGVVIGHRGETLDALQYLVSLAANAGVSGYYRVVLNIGDFRQKREKTLIDLAKRMSEQAIKSGKCRTLEPMNPYERRIIHTAVQEIEGVSSTSFGEGSGRRVVIAPEGKEARPRTNYRGANGRYNKGRGGKNGGRSSEKKEAYKPVVDPDRTPVKDADSLPLYGRIDV